MILRSDLTVGKTFDVTVAANDQREKAQTKARAASDSIKGPSLVFSSLTHIEGEITVDKREKDYQIVRLQEVTVGCKASSRRGGYRGLEVLARRGGLDPIARHGFRG